MTRSQSPYTKPASGDELYYLIRIIADVSTVLHRSIETGLKGTGVSLPMRYLMEALEDFGPRPVPKLAIGLGVTRQAVQPLVDALVADGRAELLPNSANRRSPLVRLTDKGARIFAEIQAAELTHVWRVAKQYPSVEIASTRRTLISLRRAFWALGLAGPAPDGVL
jgi:DNA-binding MarR family transcriptional regulator